LKEVKLNFLRDSSVHYACAAVLVQLSAQGIECACVISRNAFWLHAVAVTNSLFSVDFLILEGKMLGHSASNEQCKTYKIQ
jgi:hypothetical protein